MTDAVKRARDLLQSASQPRPWTVREDSIGPDRLRCMVIDRDGMWVADCGAAPDDAALIAAAPDLLRELCEEVERLRGIDTHADAKDLSVEMASHIASIDRNSNDVAEYIEDKLHRLVSRANWYEAAHGAGKAKLIESALAGVCCSGEPHTCDQEAIASAEGKTDQVMEQLTATRAALRETYAIAKRTYDMNLMTREEAERLDELAKMGGES